MAEVRIVTVCTANICRSPAAAALLRRGLSDCYPDVRVASAGTEAIAGMPACDQSSKLIGDFLAAKYPTIARNSQAAHRSRRMQAADLAQADLILALDRSHRAAVAQLHPGSRSRTFTLRQAAQAARTVEGELRANRLPDGAPPIPDDPSARFTWWVAELDAIRAFLGGETIKAPGALVIDPLDIPDPHVEGFRYHPIAVELIEQSVGALLTSLGSLREFGAPHA